MVTRVPDIGKHLATLNLFREPDGTYAITVHEAAGAIDDMTPQERDNMRPYDYVEGKILLAANRIRPPIPMVLHCPRCGQQHIDEATPTWGNPPHRSHACQTPGCGTIWRPADVTTAGVAVIGTRGKSDNWIPE